MVRSTDPGAGRATHFVAHGTCLLARRMDIGEVPALLVLGTVHKVRRAQRFVEDNMGIPGQLPVLPAVERTVATPVSSNMELPLVVVIH